jgi:hypothetical protein
VFEAVKNACKTLDVVKNRFFCSFFEQIHNGEIFTKKNLPRQSPVNPHSRRKTTLLDRSMRGFASAQPCFFPYNAAPYGSAIFPYREQKPF